MDPEPILGTLGVNLEYTHGFTHSIFSIIANSLKSVWTPGHHTLMGGALSPNCAISNTVYKVFVGYSTEKSPSPELRGSNVFQHENAPMPKASSLKTWFARVGGDKLERPAQSPNLDHRKNL